MIFGHVFHDPNRPSSRSNSQCDNIRFFDKTIITD